MSDFFNAGWSIYVAVATIVGLIACLALLIIAARRRVMASDNTTGHVWDEDLRELNNPLPRWWMWLFVLTIVFSAAYLVFYPGLGSHPQHELAKRQQASGGGIVSFVVKGGREAAWRVVRLRRLALCARAVSGAPFCLAASRPPDPQRRRGFDFLDGCSPTDARSTSPRRSSWPWSTGSVVRRHASLRTHARPSPSVSWSRAPRARAAAPARPRCARGG